MMMPPACGVPPDGPQPADVPMFQIAQWWCPESWREQRVATIVSKI